jgi:hypothetical protein
MATESSKMGLDGLRSEIERVDAANKPLPLPDLEHGDGQAKGKGKGKESVEPLGPL